MHFRYSDSEVIEFLITHTQKREDLDDPNSRMSLKGFVQFFRFIFSSTLAYRNWIV